MQYTSRAPRVWLSGRHNLTSIRQTWGVLASFPGLRQKNASKNKDIPSPHTRFLTYLYRPIRNNPRGNHLRHSHTTGPRYGRWKPPGSPTSPVKKIASSAARVKNAANARHRAFTLAHQSLADLPKHGASTKMHPKRSSAIAENTSRIGTRAPSR